MNRFLGALLISCLLVGCASKKDQPPPHGPYFYMTSPSAKDYHPPGDLTESEAQEIASHGFTYYVAYFDSKGKPEKILKVSYRETEVLKE